MNILDSKFDSDEDDDDYIPDEGMHFQQLIKWFSFYIDLAKNKGKEKDNENDSEGELNGILGLKA